MGMRGFDVNRSREAIPLLHTLLLPGRRTGLLRNVYLTLPKGFRRSTVCELEGVHEAAVLARRPLAETRARAQAAALLPVAIGALSEHDHCEVEEDFLEAFDPALKGVRLEAAGYADATERVVELLSVLRDEIYAVAGLLFADDPPGGEARLARSMVVHDDVCRVLPRDDLVIVDAGGGVICGRRLAYRIKSFAAAHARRQKWRGDGSPRFAVPTDRVAVFTIHDSLQIFHTFADMSTLTPCRAELHGGMKILHSLTSSRCSG